MFTAKVGCMKLLCNGIVGDEMGVSEILGEVECIWMEEQYLRILESR
jgi:hypothetical protein